MCSVMEEYIREYVPKYHPKCQDDTLDKGKEFHKVVMSISKRF